MGTSTGDITLSQTITAVVGSAAGAQPASGQVRALAVRGSAWTVGGYGAAQLLRLVCNAVLAYLLADNGPRIFGLMGLVTVVMQGLEMFSDIGIGPSIVQNKRGDDRAFVNTAWTVQVVRGVVLWLVACAAAVPLGLLYYPELIELLPIAGLTAVLAGLNSTSLFTANRNLALGRLTVLNLISQAVAAASMIALASVYPSIWALVAGGLIGSATRMVLSHTLMPAAGNRLQWDPDAGRELLTFGRWIFVSTGVTFLAMSVDRLLLGKLVEPEMFGIYVIAYSLATAPSQASAMLVNVVLFPALSMIHRTDPASLASKFHNARRLILWTGAVAVLGVVLLAEPFFRMIYGERYADAGWMARLMAVSVWFVVLQKSADRLLLAMGHSKALAGANCTAFAVACAVAVPGYYLYGLPGFILGYGAGAAAGYAVVALSLRRHGVPILARDIGLTCGLGALTFAAFAAAQWVEGRADGVTGQWLAAAAGAAMLLPAAIWLVLTLRREVSPA